MNPNRRPGLITAFQEYAERLTGQSKDRLMIISARSATLAGTAFGAAAVGIAIEQPIVTGVGLAVAIGATIVTRIASGVAIIRRGDPMGWFPRR